VRIVLASRNTGKLKEMQDLFAPLGVTFLSQIDFDFPSVEETGTTFVENALIKARYVCQKSNLPAIADDSGLVVPSLNGSPGIYSARYAADRHEHPPTDEDNNRKLISELSAFAQPVPAYFYCAMTFLEYADDPTPLVASAAWHGAICADPRGENGFGYDPHFLVGNSDTASAELPSKEKNRLSHRGQASRSLLAQLQSRLSPTPSPNLARN
jgi:XTP/dITP diphosphohydrolase